MRYTVLVADIFVFFPAVFALVKFVLKPKSSLALVRFVFNGLIFNVVFLPYMGTGRGHPPEIAKVGRGAPFEVHPPPRTFESMLAVAFIY